jgi:hypothetical protein
MDKPPEPDLFEKRLRFGCGFVFGGLVAFLIIAREVVVFTGSSWASVAGIALVVGFLAMLYGDEFPSHPSSSLGAHLPAKLLLRDARRRTAAPVHEGQTGRDSAPVRLATT